MVYNACFRTIVKSTGLFRFGISRCWSTHILPKLIPFEINETEARDKFHEWQSKKWLAPRKLLESPNVHIHTVYLPFWCFDAHLVFHYSATPLFKSEPGKHRKSPSVHGSLLPEFFASSLPEMQIYASYNYRRDFIEAVKLKPNIEKMQRLTKQECENLKVFDEQRVRTINLDAPTLRQCIAWELAVRSIKKQKCKQLHQTLLNSTGADDLHELDITIKILRQNVSLMYFPSYIVDYGFRRSYTSSGELRENRFQSVIGGTEDGKVSGERHYSPRKAQIAATVLAGSVGCSMALLGNKSLTVETFFWSFMAATAASMFAQFSTIRERWNQLHAMDLDHQKFTKEYFEDFANEQKEWFSNYQDSLRCESEWSQWEELRKWNWKEKERRKWCEILWREQHRRRIENTNFRIKTEQEKAKRQWDEEREHRRRKKYGESSRAQHSKSFKWNRSGGGRKDAFGFYALLGLNPQHHHSEGDIKDAFKKEAMRWHPDLHAVHLKSPNSHKLDLAQRQKRFQSLQQAYEVLKDPEKKKLYDRGELLRHNI